MKKLLTILFWSTVLVAQVKAATYYVDFDGGNNASAGTSTGTAWKHSPFDANATGNPASTTPAAGDTIQFKAGVRYKGQLIINSSGTAGNPITYKGTGWGTGKAIMDGSVLHSNAWTQCTSSGQVYGNANYASIWFSTTTFTNQTSLNTVIQSNTALPFAQITTPERPVWFDVVTNWNTEAIGNVGQSSFTDTSLFTQTDVDFWRGAHLAIHKSPNSVSIKLIAGLDPTTDTITNAAHSNTSFYDPTPFEILGHPLHISYPGEYAVITNRMWYWPTNASDPNNLQIYVAQQTNAIAISGESYITIDGFEFTGYFGPIDLSEQGVAVVQTGSGQYKGLNVLNCDISNIRSMTQAGTVNLQNASDVVVMGNSFTDCLRSRGGIYTGSNVVYASNSLVRMGGTAVFFSGVTGGLISSNRLDGIKGTHGNGLSVYSYSSDVTIERNHLTVCGSPITYEYSSNLTFRNNFVDCKYGQVDQGGGVYGPIYWLNNTLVNSDRNASSAQNHFSLNVRPAINGSSAHIYGNILDGIGGWGNYPLEQSNVYRGFNIWLGTNSGYSGIRMTNGETMNTNYTQIFVSHVGDDYRPLLSGTAYNMVTNLSSYGYTDDIVGYVRPRWNVGAYEYAPTQPSVGAIISSGIPNSKADF